MDDDVDWPDDDGGRLHGRPALSAYWTEQWQRVRVHDHPVSCRQMDDGRVAVQVEQVVRTLQGLTVSRRGHPPARLAGARFPRLDIQDASDPSLQPSTARPE